MGAFPIVRFFRLSENGVRCDAEGIHVGSTPLLRRAAFGRWAVRTRDEVEAELAAVYGLPIDLAGKLAGLATAANALDRGDAPLAAIATVLLGFPDPPELVKGASARGSPELAAQLAASRLLKGDWDETLHPRAGCPPNAGRFAPKPQESDQDGLSPIQSHPSSTSEVFRLGARLARSAIRLGADLSVDAGEAALRLGSRASGVIEAIVDLLDLPELDRGEQQVLDQLRASMDSPKTLEELQRPPTENTLGYQLHHVVEQIPANVAKSPIIDAIEKFGRAALDDPCNLVWASTFKHELISDYYNSKDEGDPTRLRRQVVDDLDFAGQFAAGLAALRKFGVLK